MEMRTPADLLAYIPILIEREPKEVLVLVSIKDDAVQAGLVMEHCTAIDEAPLYVRSVMDSLAELQSDALAMVFYTETESSCEHEPYKLVYDIITFAVQQLTDVTVLPGVLVKGGRFTCYGTGHWHDLAEVKDSVLAAGLVLGGESLVPEEASVTAPTAATEALTAAIDQAVSDMPEFPRSIAESWQHPYTREARDLFESLLQRGFGATETEAVRLIACFQHPVIRDRLMVDTLTPTMDMQTFAETITGTGMEPIPVGRVKAAVRLLNNLMQYADGRHRLTLLTTLAWLHWAQGRAGDAVMYCRAALEVDADFQLASMFLRYIHDMKRMPANIFMRLQ